jgi:acetyl esterase
MQELKFLPAVHKLFYEAKANPAPAMWEVSTQELREMRNPFITSLSGPIQKIHQVSGHLVPQKGFDIPCRLYKPNARTNLPCLIYFHGGGWVVGNVETHDNVCRKLALASGCAVFSVDYRLAPEHKFPAAADDAYASLVWLSENAESLGLDPKRLALGGDSCGGNLTAVACLMARDQNGPKIKFQLLIYPATNVSRFDSPSYDKYGDDLLLTRAGMRFFTKSYCRDEKQASDPRVSPALADSLVGLPPAMVMTAEHDVLTSDGEEFAKALERDGVTVEYICMPGTIHLFFGMEILTSKENGIDAAAHALSRALGVKTG